MYLSKSLKVKTLMEKVLEIGNDKGSKGLAANLNRLQLVLAFGYLHLNVGGVR